MLTTPTYAQSGEPLSPAGARSRGLRSHDVDDDDVPVGGRVGEPGGDADPGAASRQPGVRSGRLASDVPDLLDQLQSVRTPVATFSASRCSLFCFLFWT